MREPKTAADVEAQLARKPQRKGRSWTPEQKQEQRRKLQEYYKVNPSPAKGRVMSDEEKERRRQQANDRYKGEVLGHCFICDGPLYTEESVGVGVGPECLKRGLQEGYLRIEPDGEGGEQLVFYEIEYDPRDA